MSVEQSDGIVAACSGERRRRKGDWFNSLFAVEQCRVFACGAEEWKIWVMYSAATISSFRKKMFWLSRGLRVWFKESTRVNTFREQLRMDAPWELSHAAVLVLLLSPQSAPGMNTTLP